MTVKRDESQNSAQAKPICAIVNLSIDLHRLASDHPFFILYGAQIFMLARHEPKAERKSHKYPAGAGQRYLHLVDPEQTFTLTSRLSTARFPGKSLLGNALSHR
ncbi:hypothetical protein CDAR_570181 [Caerostris darwini]|uniref:Ycf15 n=1 Tax=Caerostris darwini TaxID=1538125 RepID=A0AAV4S308_9ARAC|nr:hypothetical protein CDAR_570181 [Caerostris darwini]